MSNFLYVDNSNVWIEGMHVAAADSGLAPNLHVAQQQNICDRTWSCDFGRLLQFAGGDRSEIGRAVLYGSRPPKNDSLWEAAKIKGFEVVVHDRSIHSNKEKKIDTNIAADIMEDSYERMDPAKDEITLVSGDADYVPVVQKLIKRGFQVHVIFWDHAARELKEVATSFTSLNKWVEHLALK